MPEILLGGTPRPVELAFMDCDGVIFDVNEHKTHSFVEAVPDYPQEAREALAAYHREHGGMSRYEKLRHFFTEIHPVEDVEGEHDKALKLFGAYSERGYEDLSPHPQAIAFAEHMGGAASAYVVSGADQQELRRIFERKGITGHFSEVFGSPSTKRVHIATVLYERFIPASRALMVGDGRTDFETARELDMPFVFLREMSNWADADEHLAGQDATFIAETWDELTSWLV